MVCTDAAGEAEMKGGRGGARCRTRRLIHSALKLKRMVSQLANGLGLRLQYSGEDTEGGERASETEAEDAGFQTDARNEGEGASWWSCVDRMQQEGSGSESGEHNGSTGER